jgi:cyclase
VSSSMSARFSRTAVVLALTMPGGPAREAAAPGLTVVRLTDDLAVIGAHPEGNVLAVLGANEVLLVDAQSAGRSAAVDTALRTITPHPVRYVVNTHYHDDHIGGNARWRGNGAILLAHTGLARYAARDTIIPELGNARFRAADAASMPTLLFDGPLTLHVGAQEVRIIHAPSAHTGGDAIVWLPKANVIHSGDIIEVGDPPFIDWWAGGTLDGMIAACEAMLALANEHTRIVPGHGSIVDRAHLVRYRDALLMLRERITVALRDTGRTPDAAAIAAELSASLGGERGALRLVQRTIVGLSMKKR